ncbi:MAG TPA: helix-turn-helix domain-containing protein [Arsenophonus sp.]
MSRGLTLLECISDSTGGISLTDLTTQTGLLNSTTHRLLETAWLHTSNQ